MMPPLFPPFHGLTQGTAPFSSAPTLTKDSHILQDVRVWRHGPDCQCYRAAEDRERLLAIAGDRNRPLKHVQRARIILLSAERLPVAEVARRAGVSRPAVWRWQRRYGEEGIDSLLRDKTRKPGRAPLSTGVVAKVLASTCSEPPGETTHWTGRAMAKAVGISLRAVQRLWEANRLQPHRLRTFKR